MAIRESGGFGSTAANVLEVAGPRMFLAPLFLCASTVLPCPSDAATPNAVGEAATALCATGLSATATSAAGNDVLVRIERTGAAASGTITAFSADKAWSGPTSAAVTETTPSAPETVFVVHAPSRIDGVTFVPATGGCTYHARVRQTNGYASGSIPVLSLTQEQPTEPASCAQPYRPPTTLRAAQPDIPYEAMVSQITGTVDVLVTLDARGVPVAADVVSSPSVLLNAASQSAAKHSTFRPEEFRCRPVASVYLFRVDYMSR